MMVRLSKTYNTNIRLPIDFCLQSGKYYSENVGIFKSYVALLGRRRVNILLDY